MRRMSAIATSETTRMLAMRRPGPPVVRSPSPSQSLSLGDVKRTTGSTPHARPATTHSAAVARNTCQSVPVISALRGSRTAVNAGSKSVSQIEISKPSTPAAVASNSASAHSSLTIRHRSAPSAERIASSRCRAAARVSNRWPTLAHASSRTNIAAAITQWNRRAASVWRTIFSGSVLFAASRRSVSADARLRCAEKSM